MWIYATAEVADSLIAVGSAGVDFDASLFVMIALFLGLMIYLNKTLFQPYLNAKDLRYTRIEGAKKSAKKLQGKAQTTFAEYEEALSAAMAEGTAERVTLKQAAKREEREVIADARRDIEKMLQDARSKLNAEIDKAAVMLDKEAAALSEIIVEKVMG